MEGIQNVLLVAYLLIVLALIAVILLQRSEGGGLGMGGNAGGLMTVRGSANLLTRTTAVLAALFFATAIALTILSSVGRTSNSVLDGGAPASAASNASAPLNILDALSKQQGDAPAPVAPAASSAAGANDQGLALPVAPASTAPSAAESSAPPSSAASAPSAPSQ